MAYCAIREFSWAGIGIWVRNGMGMGLKVDISSLWNVNGNCCMGIGGNGNQKRIPTDHYFEDCMQTGRKIAGSIHSLSVKIRSVSARPKSPRSLLSFETVRPRYFRRGQWNWHRMRCVACRLNSLIVTYKSRISKVNAIFHMWSDVGPVLKTLYKAVASILPLRYGHWNGQWQVFCHYFVTFLISSLGAYAL